MNASLTKNQGLQKIEKLNAKVEDRSFTEVLVDLLNQNIPPELVTRLESLWEATKTIAGEVIQIGKIIVLKIVDFIRDNPNFGIALAIGAAVGALVGMVPFLGSLLQPILTVAVALIVAGGERGMLGGATELATKFFELLASIFNALRDYWVEGSTAG